MEQSLANTRIKPNVYVARSLLQEQDRRFLHLVMLCGGYFTRSQAARLRLRDTAAASDRQLRFLEWLGLVKRMRLSSDPRCPQVYKLTARGTARQRKVKSLCGCRSGGRAGSAGPSTRANDTELLPRGQ